MQWTPEAENAVKRVPFFIRPKVRKAVERVASSLGSRKVTLDHVIQCKKRYLSGQHDEVQGYQVETCFGPSGCQNRAVSFQGMADDVEEILRQKGVADFIKRGVTGPLKPHHEFRISISDCPNGCSRPQIADIGLLGATMPDTTGGSLCNGCHSCTEVCREEAVQVDHSGPGPTVDTDRCLGCGQCVTMCPTGAIQASVQGYRVLVGGKLGRHPQLGIELGVFSPVETLQLIERAVDLYLESGRPGERFGTLLQRLGLDTVKEYLLK